ncbi:hypothetical protein KCP76_19200 [Salmonella enterica subsp. enterica serovar Weltevreden]|nr:hypothetical protein KCP76_19200 [Salmonella enterica subsp. enterica serovar Weltevreden]
MLPAEVLKLAQQEPRDRHGLGTSVRKLAIEAKEFIQNAEEAEQDFGDPIIPNHKVLFCHLSGGSRQVCWRPKLPPAIKPHGGLRRCWLPAASATVPARVQNTRQRRSIYRRQNQPLTANAANHASAAFR